MKNAIHLFLLTTCSLFTACSSLQTSEGGPMVRLLVSQSTNDFAIIDLDSTTNIQTYSLEQSYEGGTAPVGYSQINAKGFSGIVVGSKGEPHLVNLFTGSNQLIQSNIEDQSQYVPLANGTAYLTRRSASNTLYFANLLGQPQNPGLVVEGISIVDIAICDDNKTALIIGMEDYSSSQNYIQSISISSTGQLTPGQRLVTNSIPRQIECAPGSQMGAYLSTGGLEVHSSQFVTTFQINPIGDLTEVSHQDAVILPAPDQSLPYTQQRQVVSLVFSPDGNNLYLRILIPTNLHFQDWMVRFTVQSNGVITPTSWTSDLRDIIRGGANFDGTQNNREIYRIAIHPDGSKFYFPSQSICTNVNDDMGGTVLQCRPGIQAIRTSDGRRGQSFHHDLIRTPLFVSVASSVECFDLENDGCELHED